MRSCVRRGTENLQPCRAVIYTPSVPKYRSLGTLFRPGENQQNDIITPLILNPPPTIVFHLRPHRRPLHQRVHAQDLLAGAGLFHAQDLLAGCWALPRPRPGGGELVLSSSSPAPRWRRAGAQALPQFCSPVAQFSILLAPGSSLLPELCCHLKHWCSKVLASVLNFWNLVFLCPNHLSLSTL